MPILFCVVCVCACVAQSSDVLTHLQVLRRPLVPTPLSQPQRCRLLACSAAAAATTTARASAAQMVLLFCVNECPSIEGLACVLCQRFLDCSLFIACRNDRVQTVSHFLWPRACMCPSCHMTKMIKPQHHPAPALNLLRFYTHTRIQPPPLAPVRKVIQPGVRPDGCCQGVLLCTGTSTLWSIFACSCVP